MQHAADVHVRVAELTVKPGRPVAIAGVEDAIADVWRVVRRACASDRGWRDVDADHGRELAPDPRGRLAIRRYDPVGTQPRGGALAHIAAWA